jgi:hypothetical protein
MDKLELTVTRWLSVKAEGKVALGVLAIVVLCSAGAFGIWTLH